MASLSDERTYTQADIIRLATQTMQRTTKEAVMDIFKGEPYKVTRLTLMDPALYPQFVAALEAL
jgi:hypothetical protein